MERVRHLLDITHYLRAGLAKGRTLLQTIDHCGRWALLLVPRARPPLSP